MPRQSSWIATARVAHLAMTIMGFGTTSGLIAADPFTLKYAFGTTPYPGYTAVKPEETYNPARTYGFDLGSRVAAGSNFVTGQDGRPFFFSSRLDPGVYRVTITLGDPSAETIATVKSETRRLMLEAVRVPAGQTKVFTFLTHVRSPRLPNGELVRLKAREKEPILYVQWDETDVATRLPFVELDWDEKLTLAFSDAHPALNAIEITPAEKPTTVYLVGDSTMTDQMMEPFGAWGQQFPRWFKAPVVIANYAESGESARSFLGERRWEKLMSDLRAGDFVLIQFGINDRSGPPEQFKTSLATFIKDARAKGATPILVTSQNLKRLDANGKVGQTLPLFVDAMKEVAAQHQATLIDLNAMSATLYETLGRANLDRAFVDGTHHTMYGAYELAKCVVQALVTAKVPFVAGNLADDWQPFDPAKPDPLESFKMARDPQLDPARPGGPGTPDRRGPMAGDVRK